MIGGFDLFVDIGFFEVGVGEEGCEGRSRGEGVLNISLSKFLVGVFMWCYLICYIMKGVGRVFVFIYRKKMCYKF